MLAISDIIEQIETYKREAGHPPGRIAVTPAQMKSITSEPNAKRALGRSEGGLVTVAGVEIDVWGRPA